jgi:hypothetical protein
LLPLAHLWNAVMYRVVRRSKVATPPLQPAAEIGLFFGTHKHVWPRWAVPDSLPRAKAPSTVA